ncbi:diguanylate cyclase [Dyella sp. BiH032]|uniref:GGDEF domain-containing protein n=1 Tax=Dyella sp. BiH032 TaxID=3075430 RepID=UPI0028934C9C|nr:diguanylate cyclase [Dyella sp. BiH032]WNL45345.1 diguanylate cyclase [Dyella sp. BiH032]
MQLDLPTLLFVSFLAAISAAIGFTSLMLVLRGQAALRIWVASLWVSTIGITLISLRGQIPDVLSIVLANSLIALAGALMVRGLALHLARPFRWRVPLAIVLLYASGIAWFAYVVPDLRTRIVLASVQAVVWDVWCVVLLLGFAPREIRLSARILALVMAADALLFTVRPFVPLSPGAAGSIFRAGAPVTLTYVAGIVISLAAYFALLLMITERLMVDLRRAASVDALTGLLNRGAMLAEGRRALAASAVQGRPCAILALDLDRFKQINDRWGHEGGDAVLVHASAVLREVVAWPGHAVGRYGGEEFLLTLPGAGLREASELAERLRAALAGSSVLLNGHRLRVTTSIGVAVGEGGASTFEQLVSSADRALYRAKSDGRNCVRQQLPEGMPLP